MKTLINNIEDETNKVNELFLVFLKEHCSVYKWNIDDGYILFFSPDGDYAFKELTPAGKIIQSKLYQRYKHFYNLIATLICNQIESTRKEFEEANNKLLNYISHEKAIYLRSIDEVIQDTVNTLYDIISKLKNLYLSSDKNITLIPDTNALIHKPDFENWDIAIKPFVILLTPILLSELDKLKIEHRNQEVREKAKSVINRIKGYRNRGSLFEGVTIKNNVSLLKSIAHEPNFNNSPSWLDRENNDDRLIALYFEILRNQPNQNILLVTGDINLQNKAEFALIPFIDIQDL